MALNFIYPKKKHIFNQVTKIWWMYIGITSVILFFCFGYLSLDIVRTQRMIENYKKEQIELQTKIKAADNYFERLNYESDLSYLRLDTNDIRREKLQNILNLIPDKITIDSIELSENTLIIKGITPSREFFYFGLHASLKANFGKSSVNFYGLSNGWQQFVSISYTQNTSGESK